MKRRWRVVLLRAKGEILGTVEAPDVEAAKAAAAVQFDLDEVRSGQGCEERWAGDAMARAGALSVPASAARDRPQMALKWGIMRGAMNVALPRASLP